MIDRWKLTSYCLCNPSTTRGHFERSDDELAVWVVLEDHEAALAARDQALKDLGCQLGQAEQELANAQHDIERLQAAASAEANEVERLRAVLETLQRSHSLPPVERKIIRNALPQPTSLYKCDQCGTPMRCGPTRWEYQCGCDRGHSPQSDKYKHGLTP